MSPVRPVTSVNLSVLGLHHWLRSLHEVPEPTVDRIIIGSTGTPVRGIAVVWMPTWNTLRVAEKQGLNVVIAHEPTFFSHHDLDGFEAAQRDLPPRARAALEGVRDAKRRWIEDIGMAVIRCHDVLDAMLGGVVDSLAEQLGFRPADYVKSWRGYRVVRLASPATAADVAQRLANAFSAIGQPGVGFYGDPARVVKTLGLGTGFGCEPWRFVELGADMALTIDDRIKTWIEGEWADDSGFPLAVINHGTSEEWGVRTLARRLKEAFPALPVQLIPQGCGYRWVQPK
jgi:putative NIF3 family GTP cyclohydrolase 1 type 2